MISTSLAPATSNRVWLKGLAARSDSAWMTRVLPCSLDGVCRVETVRTVYVFVDGVCTEAARRDEDAEQENAMLGMQLVGWVVDRDGDRLVVEAWRPGARAILWRPRGADDCACKIALTSGTFAFVRPRRRLIEQATPSPELRPVRPAALSMTRVDIPLRQPA